MPSATLVSKSMAATSEMNEVEGNQKFLRKQEEKTHGSGEGGTFNHSAES